MSKALNQASIWILNEYMKKNFKQAQISSEKIIRQENGFADEILYHIAASCCCYTNNKSKYDSLVNLFDEKITNNLYPLRPWSEEKEKLDFSNVTVLTPNQNTHESVLLSEFKIFKRNFFESRKGKLFLGSFDFTKNEESLIQWFQELNLFLEEIFATKKSASSNDSNVQLFLDIIPGNTLTLLPSTKEGRIFQLNIFQAVGDYDSYQIAADQLFSQYGFTANNYSEKMILKKEYESHAKSFNQQRIVLIEHSDFNIIQSNTTEINHEDFEKIKDYINRTRVKGRILLDFRNVHFFQILDIEDTFSLLDGFDKEVLIEDPVLKLTLPYLSSFKA